MEKMGAQDGYNIIECGRNRNQVERRDRILLVFRMDRPPYEPDSRNLVVGSDRQKEDQIGDAR
jgi:hypothetical protein